MTVRDVEIEVDAAIFEIAQAWGIRTDKVAPIVDEYGVDLSRAALKTVQAEMADGYKPSSPMGYMISLLRKGVIQAEQRVPTPEYVDRLRDRYESAQANPEYDTAAKRLDAVKITDPYLLECLREKGMEP